MRIVIDMQGAQTESRYRGIGRYSLSLALAIARQRGEHEIVLALNGFFAETILPIREAFHGILPVANILVWNGVSPTRETSLDNRLRREISERLREAFLQALCPDLILVTSLFEGFGDDAVTSVGVFDQQTPVAVILYDLIPLISPDEHFVASAEQQAHYNRKIDSLKRSNLLLAISNSAKREAVDALHVDEDEVENISGAFDTSFRIKSISEEKRAKCLGRYGIDHPFVRR
jgi:glycosyltransferase involved in cell wall biosynthesis